MAVNTWKSSFSWFCGCCCWWWWANANSLTFFNFFFPKQEEEEDKSETDGRTEGQQRQIEHKDAVLPTILNPKLVEGRDWQIICSISQFIVFLLANDLDKIMKFFKLMALHLHSKHNQIREKVHSFSKFKFYIDTKYLLYRQKKLRYSYKIESALHDICFSDYFHKVKNRICTEWYLFGWLFSQSEEYQL